MTKCLSEIEDETICNEEVNIISMTSEYEILISEIETNAINDTACSKTESAEKCFFSLISSNV